MYRSCPVTGLAEKVIALSIAVVVGRWLLVRRPWRAVFDRWFRS